MFNFYPWGLSINIVLPINTEKTKIKFLSYIWDESKLDSGAGSELDKVEKEDEEIVEKVQRGVKSRFYDRGHFSPTMEKGVHHFHLLLKNNSNIDTFKSVFQTLINEDFGNIEGFPEFKKLLNNGIEEFLNDFWNVGSDLEIYLAKLK